MQKTTRRLFGRGGTHRREGMEQPARAADLTLRGLDPEVLEQLRELQEWAVRSRTAQHDGRLASLAALPAIEALEAGQDTAPRAAAMAAPAPVEAETAEAAATEVMVPAAVMATAEEGAPSATPEALGTAEVAATAADVTPAAATQTRPGIRPAGPPFLPGWAAARPGRVAGIATLLLLVALDGYLLAHRQARDVEPDAGSAAVGPAYRRPDPSTRPSPARAPAAPASAVAASGATTSAATASAAPPASSEPAAPLAAAPAPVQETPAQASPAPASPPQQAPIVAWPSTAAAAAAPVSSRERPASSDATTSPEARRRATGGSGSSGRRVVPARTTPSSRRGTALRPASGIRPPVLLSAPRIKSSLPRERRGSTGRVEIGDRRHRAVNHIQLAVLVDELGYVVTAQVKGGDTSQIGADRAALSAAMAARFRPATRHGVPCEMWTTMTFDFPQ